MIAKTSTPENLTAEAAYDDTYRFRLWVAAVEDSSSLGMGFRAYHSHISRSLDHWSKYGVEFASATGIPLNIDCLSADDLYGFLGKKNMMPRGPGRRISPDKIAVLDLYFKKKLPEVAASFGSSDLRTLISYALNTFYLPDDQISRSHEMVREVISNGEAIFFPTASEVIERFDPLSAETAYVNALIVGFRPCRNHYVVRKIRMPLHHDFVVSGSALHEKMKFWYGPKAAVGEGAEIYSGIGVPVANGHNYTSVVTLLRERTTHAPYITNLSLAWQAHAHTKNSYFIVHDISTWLYNETFQLLEDKEINANIEGVFKPLFIELIRDLHSSIGMEI